MWAQTGPVDRPPGANTPVPTGGHGSPSWGVDALAPAWCPQHSEPGEGGPAEPHTLEMAEVAGDAGAADATA